MYLAGSEAMFTLLLFAYLLVLELCVLEAAVDMACGE